jgi:hypothetical protein
LSTQIKDKPGDDILLSKNAAQVTAYIALQDEVKKLKKNRSSRTKQSQKKCKIGNPKTMPPLMTNQSDPKRQTLHVQHYIAGATELKNPMNHANAK